MTLNRTTTPVLVHGFWSKRTCKGPFGQTACRLPISACEPSERLIDLTPEEASRLTSCTCCGRATVNPTLCVKVYQTPGYVFKPFPVCEICVARKDEYGYVTGWWGSPYRVLPTTAR